MRIITLKIKKKYQNTVDLKKTVRILKIDLKILSHEEGFEVIRGEF